jgi:hypothetical protein
VTGDDPNRDYCVYYGYTGQCTKDCAGDFDCPRGFNCVDSDGHLMCLPRAGSCDLLLDVMGDTCGTSDECPYMTCQGGVCTTDCTIEHDCPGTLSCIDGWCVPD